MTDHFDIGLYLKNEPLPLGLGISKNVEFVTTIGALLAIIVAWTINRLTLRSKILTNLTELPIIWSLVVVLSPVLLLSLIILITFRCLLTIGLKLQYGNRIFLAHPMDSPWGFENPGSTSTCNALYIFEGKGDLQNVRNYWNTRIVNKVVNGVKIYERFTWCLRRFYGFVCWERLNEFHINNHVNYLSTRSQSHKDPNYAWTEEEIFEEFQALQETSLNCKNQSPWELLLVPRFKYTYGEPGKEYYAFVFRMHHAIMDGVSIGNALLHFADHPFKFPIDPTAPLKSSGFAIMMTYLVAFINFPRVLLINGYLGFMDKRKLPAPTLTGPKTFTWSRPIRLKTVQDMKSLTKTSLISVLLACLGGAMRKLFIKNKLKLPEVIHCCPAVAILPYPDRNPRNQFSFVVHPVHIGKITVLTRLKSIYKNSLELPSSSQAISNYYLIYLFGLIPVPVLNLLGTLSHVTMLLSNNPGPMEKIKVMNGDTLIEYGFWAPLKNTTGIGTTVVSYGDYLRMAIVTDAGTLGNSTDTQFLCDAFQEEISELANNFQIDQQKLFM